MLHLYTFCVDIGRISPPMLELALEWLVKSLDKHNRFTLHVFTNMECSLEHPNVVYEEYFDNSEEDLFGDNWLNLSWNKINIWQHLYETTGESYTWIDLDTIVTANIEYINDYDHIFLETGGGCEEPNLLFDNNTEITVPRNRYIQGNLWKLNAELYEALLATFTDLQKLGLELRYDFQDLVNYYHHIKEMPLWILGFNVEAHTINGLGIWHPSDRVHVRFEGLEKLWWDEEILRSEYYPDKEIHLVTLTFGSVMHHVMGTSLFNDFVEDCL